jgi:hypothetical protein
MKWLPTSGMWLTKIAVDTPASELTHDLAVDASGFGRPNPSAAGMEVSQHPVVDPGWWPIAWVVLASILVVGVAFALGRRRSTPTAA